ncbi:hypothetical protein HanIR_Chr01g0007991 [Helianthus annuus]|nr:hypothetical protein HanIR_Chr01g0007991 [Helianthus annuus]
MKPTCFSTLLPFILPFISTLFNSCCSIDVEITLPTSSSTSYSLAYSFSSSYSSTQSQYNISSLISLFPLETGRRLLDFCTLHGLLLTSVCLLLLLSLSSSSSCLSSKRLVVAHCFLFDSSFLFKSPLFLEFCFPFEALQSLGGLPLRFEALDLLRGGYRV